MKTNTGVRIHLGAMNRALNQSGARPPRGRTTAEPSSLLSSATWNAGNICPSLNCAELLEHVLGADLWRLPRRQQCALILKYGNIERAGGRNCTPGPEIATAVRQWRLIRGVSNSLDQYTDPQANSRPVVSDIDQAQPKPCGDGIKHNYHDEHDAKTGECRWEVAIIQKLLDPIPESARINDAEHTGGPNVVFEHEEAR